MPIFFPWRFVPLSAGTVSVKNGALLMEVYIIIQILYLSKKFDSNIFYQEKLRTKQFNLCKALGKE